MVHTRDPAYTCHKLGVDTKEGRVTNVWTVYLPLFFFFLTPLTQVEGTASASTTKRTTTSSGEPPLERKHMVDIVPRGTKNCMFFFLFIYLSRLLFSFDTPSAENFNPFYFSFHVDQFCLAPFSHACSKYSNARIPLERTQPENRFIRSRCCVHNMIPFSFFQTGLHNRQKDNKLVHHHSTACWVLSN